MANQGIDFSRQMLKLVLGSVRTYHPTIKVSEAWVWKAGRDHWEFHYQGFYWHGSASDAYDARANGWEAWLRSQGVE